MLKRVEKKFIDIKSVFQNRKNGRIKNIGGKEKGDNMTKTKDDMTLTELQTNELLNTEATAIEKKLKQ